METTNNTNKYVFAALVILVLCGLYWYFYIYKTTTTTGTTTTGTTTATTATGTTTGTTTTGTTLVSGTTYIVKEALFGGTLYDRDATRYAKSTASGGANANNYLASSTATTTDVTGGLLFKSGTFYDPLTGNYLGTDLQFHAAGSSQAAAAIALTTSGILTLGGTTLYAVTWYLGDGTQAYFTTTAAGHGGFTCTIKAV